MNTSWLLSSSDSTTDYKELIPEFFFLHEFLSNKQGFNFGVRQNGDNIDNVVLPAWCQHSPRLFTCVMRQAIESNNVTLNLHHWIDLVFGFKQSGRAALDAINCYHPACYFGYPVDQISDPVHRKAIETMIKTWGQTPKQLFTSPHPISLLGAQLKKSSSTPTSFSNILISSAINSSPSDLPPTSIHRLILNLKWGSYVGSPEQTSAPVCVWRESFKKNVISLHSLPSNEMLGLSINKCILIERPKETGNYYFTVFILKNLHFILNQRSFQSGQSK